MPKGNKVELCFWYTSPIDEAPDTGEIQGFSMALCYGCVLTCDETSFRFPPGSVTATLEGEFVAFDCDDDPADGDGCEVDPFPWLARDRLPCIRPPAGAWWRRRGSTIVPAVGVGRHQRRRGARRAKRRPRGSILEGGKS